MSSRIGIVAALSGELKPLVRGWERHPDGVYESQQGSITALAIAGGMGTDNAARAVQQIATHGALNALVSFGWAGATTCGVQPGMAYEVGEVIDEVSGMRYATAHEPNLVKLVTSPRILGRKEKRSRAEELRTSFVDMEAAAVAEAAKHRNIPFYCWKAITDTSTEELPDLNQFVVDHHLQLGSLAAHVLVHPRYVAPLIRMGRNSRSGAAALAKTVQHWLTTMQASDAGTHTQGNYADSRR